MGLMELFKPIAKGMLHKRRKEQPAPTALRPNVPPADELKPGFRLPLAPVPRERETEPTS